MKDVRVSYKINLKSALLVPVINTAHLYTVQNKLKLDVFGWEDARGLK